MSGEVTLSDEAYGELPAQGPNKSELGSAFITLVEPHPGHERTYNRWYEDDHFYAGAMSFPWWFAGRRWVAPRRLRTLRTPEHSPIADPVDAGCYLGTYWVTAGHHTEQLRWLHATVNRLAAEGRMFEHRTHVHTSFYTPVASKRATPHGPTALHALDSPYSGLVIETIDCLPGVTRDELLAELTASGIDHTLGGEVDQCVVMTPREWPSDIELWFNHAPTPPDRVLLMWFLNEQPESCWGQRFDRAERPLVTRGRSSFVAGFIPTVPGTDTYVDELR